MSAESRGHSVTKARVISKLAKLARLAEMTIHIRNNVTIDWTLHESALARIKVMVKRIVNNYGYPPDLQPEAVKTVLARLTGCAQSGFKQNAICGF
jgi:type I restriction enzyme, R subunit